MSRPIPMIDDVPLDAVLEARHHLRQRMISAPVVGLEGDVQQHMGRRSHDIELHGVLTGDTAADDLATLQDKAGSGEEVDFTVDISTALEIDKAVIVELEVWESAGRPDRYEYRLLVRESPPLPEPAQLSPFGGLDGLDVGFDTDVLGDIADAADQLQDGLDLVNDALGQLEALEALSGLTAGNPVEPMQKEVKSVAAAGEAAAKAGVALEGLLGGDE